MAITDKKQIDEWITNSKTAQDRRRLIPLTDVQGRTPIPQKQMIARIAKDVYKDKQNGEYHYLFGDMDKIQQNVFEGWEPCRDVDGKLATYGTSNDPMIRLPMDIYRRQLEETAERGSKMIADEKAKDKKLSAKNPVSGGEETEEIKPGTEAYEKIMGGR